MEDFQDKKKEPLSIKRVYQMEDNQEVQYLFRNYIGTHKPRAYFIPILSKLGVGDLLLLREETSKLVQSVGEAIGEKGELNGILFDDGTVVYSGINSQSQPK